MVDIRLMLSSETTKWILTQYSLNYFQLEEGLYWLNFAIKSKKPVRPNSLIHICLFVVDTRSRSYRINEREVYIRVDFVSIIVPTLSRTSGMSLFAWSAVPNGRKMKAANCKINKNI